MEGCCQSLIRVPCASTSHLACSSQPVVVRCGGSGTFSVGTLKQPVSPVKSSALRWRGDQTLVSPRRQISSLDLRAAASTAGSASEQKTAPSPSETISREDDGRVQQIHSLDEFDAALKNARDKLVVVEYAASHSKNSRSIYPAMVDLSRSCQDVEFLLVMGDESKATEELCTRAGVSKVPHFEFYKNQEKIHEEQGGIDEERLTGDVLYYGDHDAPVRHLDGMKELEALLAENAADNRLVVVDIGLKKCGPCVKVYPTFVKLAKRMMGSVAFARMHGDENEDTMQFMKKMEVVEVPTFLFIKQRKICGRYVGSGKGELIGEILRYQGVRVTY
eukprot:TRINITY_DN22553_c0_g1_i1.p1 TRINITY_DN22553_c0_g1~~TRINITY_DN22553_c0_g1_i1.p1  ORF type:complete len:333 (+),score=33.14 TRINITY_DN22553_c0_g1_i1:58-1056(+)